MPDVLASKLTRQHAHELLRLETDELAKLGKVYEQARLELLGRLTALGDASKADTFTAQSLRGALAQIRAGVEVIVGKIDGAHRSSILSAAQNGALQTLDEIAFFERSRDFRGAALGAIQTQALRSLMRQEGLLLNRFEVSVQTYGTTLIGDIQRRLGVHVAMRSKWTDMAADVAGRLNGAGVTGSQWRAERIVRTELVNAVNVGGQAALEAAEPKLPDLMAQWDAYLDKRTSDVCRGLDGQIKPIREGWVYGGKRIMHPPAHPNCRSRQIPYRPQWEGLVVPEPPEPRPAPLPTRQELELRRAQAQANAGALPPVSPKTAKDVTAAKGALEKALLEKPGDADGIAALQGDLERTLVGYHKAKGLSGQSLAQTVASDLSKALVAAQSKLDKARKGAAQALAFHKKGLAELVEKAAGEVPPNGVGALKEAAKHLGKLEGVADDALEAFVAGHLDEAIAEAGAKYADKLGLAAGKLAEAQAGVLKAVGTTDDLAPALADVEKAAAAQGRLKGLKGDDLKAHVAAELEDARQAAGDALTPVVIAARNDFVSKTVHEITTGGLGPNADFKKKSRLWHSLKNGLSGDELDAAVQQDLAKASDAAWAQVKAAKTAAAAEAAKPHWAALKEPGLTESHVQAAKTLLKIDNLDDVAKALGTTAENVVELAKDTLNVEVEGLIGKQARALVLAQAGKGDPALHGILLGQIEDLAKVLNPKDATAVQELVQSAKNDAADLLEAWNKADFKVKELKQTALEKKLLGMDGDATTSHLESALSEKSMIEGSAWSPNPGQVEGTIDSLASQWKKAAEDVFDDEKALKAFHALQEIDPADYASVGGDALLQAKVVHLKSSLATDDIPGFKSKAQQILEAKGEPIPSPGVLAEIKAAAKPIDTAQLAAEYEDAIALAIDQIPTGSKPAINLSLEEAYKKAAAWGKTASKTAAQAQAHAEHTFQTVVQALKDGSESDTVASLIAKQQAGTALTFPEALALENAPAAVLKVAAKKLGITTDAAYDSVEFAAELLKEAPPGSQVYQKVALKLKAGTQQAIQKAGIKAAQEEIAAASGAPPNIETPKKKATGKKLVDPKAAATVEETTWPATQSGAPEKITLPDGSSATKVAASSGSNAGGFYKVEGSGETYFVKFPKAVGQVGAEKVSADLASLMGLAKKDYTAFPVGTKHVAISSPKIAFKELSGSKLAGWADQDELARHFLHAAWTRNWDVVGLGFDNLVEKGGKLLGVDYGGSLLWRAQGALKADGMPAAVAELKSLRDASSNAQTAAAFGHLTDEKLAQTIKATISTLDDDAIEQIVATGKFAKADREAITKGLLERKAWLDEWADEVLGKAVAAKTPEQIAKDLLGKLPNDPDAALIFKAGSGGGAGPDSLRKAYRDALAGDVSAQAKIGRRLWGGTPALEANRDAGARFLIAAWKKNADVVRTELQGSAWADAMKPVLDTLEKHGSKLATPEQLFEKLKAVELAAKKAAEKAAKEAAEKAAEAKLALEAKKAEWAAKHADYLAEKAAFDEKIAAWKVAVEKIQGKVSTATGEITAAYEKKLGAWADKLSTWSKGAGSPEIRQKAADALAVWNKAQTDRKAFIEHLDAKIAPLEARKKAGEYLSWSERDELKKAKASRTFHLAELKSAKVAFRKSIEEVAEQAGILPKKPVAPKPPPGLGGTKRPDRFNANHNPTANPNAGHPQWSERVAEMRQIGRDLGMPQDAVERDIRAIERAIGNWKGSATPCRTAQKYLFQGLDEVQIRAKGVSQSAIDDAKAFSSPLWERASGHDGEIWRGESWVHNPGTEGGRSQQQNREWLKQFLAENEGGEWTWPYSAGWATNNGFQGKGYGGRMPIQYHIVGKSSARSFKNIHGFDSERELQTKPGAKFRILSYRWHDTPNAHGHEVIIDLVEVFDDGTTGLD